MNVNLTKEQKDYRHHVIMDLRAEIEKGWNGPDSSMSINEIVDSKIKLIKGNS
ncbi:hypothetical protein [Flavivirga jejuensis]|uniref:Uncharacterized protein n=1 Tax=Flavivirga jejuensis TaxID=870487 RepID=A0ABT8WM90_9FLAO|nr:hypothetical protein [Flavivirga jejuensis]MDO5974257.1 hypothetical protein [Flavivirga jejuensis]